MRVAVISPHLDDAVFSVAEHMLSRPDWDFTIITPFAAAPEGNEKYATLRAEHSAVCAAGGWTEVNGPFFDDAFATRTDISTLRLWLQLATPPDVEAVWMPVGIHHPDHRSVRAATRNDGTPFWLYEELPYRVLYPREFGLQARKMVGYDPSMLERKKELCRMYASQIGPDIERCLYVPERLWGPW